MDNLSGWMELRLDGVHDDPPDGTLLWTWRSSLLVRAQVSWKLKTELFYARTAFFAALLHQALSVVHVDLPGRRLWSNDVGVI